MKKIPDKRGWGHPSCRQWSQLNKVHNHRIISLDKVKLCQMIIGGFMMKEKEKKSNTNESNKNLQQQDSSFNMDEFEDIQPYEPYDKNRIDTTNL
jgi:hypothetical protein